jgi:hypothetical protein
VSEKKPRARLGRRSWWFDVLFLATVLILGYFETQSLNFLMAVPLYFFGFIASFLGVIPIAGPLIYFFGIGTLFNALLSTFHISMPVTSAVIFWYFFGLTVLYNVIILLILVLAKTAQ